MPVNMRATSALAISAICGVVALAGVDLQPRVLALTGATVAVGDDRVLPGATILVRDGFIAAVGANVPVPADAVRVDLTGQFVYPGLIDTLSEQGSKHDPHAETDPEKKVPQYAWIAAAERLAPQGASLASWRDAGVLAINVAPNEGIFRGRTAVVFTGDGDLADQVVRAPVFMQTSLRGLGYRNRRLGMPEPGGVYPTRLIGVLPYVRQTLLDAQRYDLLHRAYEASPAGMAPPAHDRGLEALVPVVRGTLPVALEANEEREFTRLLGLITELNLNAVFVGGYEAPLVADALAARKIPVLVSLNFPGPDSDVPPDFAVPSRVLAQRAHAPATAGELARAGVRIAFASDGLQDGRQFLSNLRLAVRRGLPPQAALRSATLEAARLLGVERQLGTVEPGKIANLVVTDAALFSDAARIRFVLVQGRRYDVPGARQTVAAAPDRPAVDLPVHAPVAPHDLLITHASLMTVSHGTIRNGSMLIRGGKIAAIGTDVAAPPGVDVFDASGKWIMPGIIDAHSHQATDSHNEATSNVTAMAQIVNTINPTDAAIWRELAAGVTMANTLHGSVNPIGGQTAVIKLRWGRPYQDMLVTGAKPSLKFAIKEFARRRGSSPPSSLMGMDTVIRDTLLQAREYGREWDAYRAAKAAGTAPIVPPRRDLAMEPLVEVLEGRRFVHAHVYTREESLVLLRIAEEFGFKVVLQHAKEAYKIAEEIRRHGGGGASLFSDLGGASPYVAAMLTRAGVVASINSDGEPVARYLLQQAAATMRYGGLTEDEALALVTLNPARQLRLDDRVGSLDTGKDADFVVYDRYPMSTYAVPHTVYIDGVVYYSREMEAERLRRAADVRQRLAPWAVADAAEARGSKDTLQRADAVAVGREVVPAATTQPPASGVYAIRDARIVTVSGPVLERGTVVIRDGVITDVAMAAVVPAGATVVDGRGLTVYPGLIDANAALGMKEAAPERELGSLAPELQAFVTYRVDSDIIPIARAVGVTNVMARPSGGLIPGQGSVMNLGGRTADQAVARRNGPLVIQFPTVGELYFTDDERFAVDPYSATKASYDRQLRQIRELLASAHAYRDAKAAAAKDGRSPLPANARLEALIPIIEGRQPVLFETRNHVDMRNAVEFAEAAHLDFFVGGPEDTWKIVPFLKEHGARVVLQPSQNVPGGDDDPVDAVYRTAAILHDAGVPFAFGSVGGVGLDARSLPAQAGYAVAYGLPWDAALRALTITPAMFYGIADRYGTIERGRRANLVVAEGDIFDVTTRVRHVFIDGRPVTLETVDSIEFERYREK